METAFYQALETLQNQKKKKTDAKLHVPLVTLSTKDNVNLTKKIKWGI